MTAQQINHIANLAAERAASCAHYNHESWEAVIALKRLARSVADREIEAQGYSDLYAPLS